MKPMIALPLLLHSSRDWFRGPGSTEDVQRPRTSNIVSARVIDTECDEVFTDVFIGFVVVHNISFADSEGFEDFLRLTHGRLTPLFVFYGCQGTGIVCNCEKCVDGVSGL